MLCGQQQISNPFCCLRPCHDGHDSYIAVEVQVSWDFQLVFLVNC